MDRFEDDDRISAYLDGELTADEQSQFEERLAESAELRQLVEELRALRGSLDLLPRHRLEEDFAERVLRRAEREMLTAGQSPSNGTAASDTATSDTATSDTAISATAAPDAATTDPIVDDRPSLVAERSQSRPRRWRPVIYAAATIAAAVVIMVFNRPRQDNREVAQVSPAKDASEYKRELSQNDSPLAENRKQIEDRSAREKRLFKSSSDSQAAGLPAGGSGGGQQAEKKLVESADKPGKDAKELDGAQRQRDLGADVEGLRESDKIPTGALTKTPSPSGDISDRGPQSAPASTATTAGRIATSSDAKSTQPDIATIRTDNASSPRGSGAAAKGTVGKDQSSPRYRLPMGAEGGLRRPESQVLDDRVVTREEMLRQAATDGRLLVAKYSIGDASAETRFSQLLTEHKFTIAQAKANLSRGGYAGTESGSGVAHGGASPANQPEAWNMQVDRFREAEQITARDKSDTNKDALSEPVDAYYVEGTSEQVKALIQDLEHDTSVFHSVSWAVEPTSSVTNDYGIQVPPTTGFGNGSLNFQSGPYGSTQPALQQSDASKAVHPDAAAGDARPPAPVTQLDVAGAKASEDAGRAKHADGERTTVEDAAKLKAPPTDASKKETAASEFRGAKAADERAKPAGPAPAAAPATSAPLLKEQIADQPPQPEKPTEPADLKAAKPSDETTLNRDLSRSYSYAIHLRGVEKKPTGAAKLADQEGVNGTVVDARIKPSEENVASGKRDSTQLGGFGAMQGTPASPGAGGVPMRPAAKPESLGLEPKDAQNSGRVRERANEADAKLATGENKAGETKNDTNFYAHIDPQTWGDGMTTGPARMSAVFIFRTAPQTAAEAGAAAPPAVPVAAPPPAKK